MMGCSNHGECVENNLNSYCVCEEGWIGETCSVSVCNNTNCSSSNTNYWFGVELKQFQFVKIVSMEIVPFKEVNKFAFVSPVLQDPIVRRLYFSLVNKVLILFVLFFSVIFILSLAIIGITLISFLVFTLLIISFFVLQHLSKNPKKRAEEDFDFLPAFFSKKSQKPQPSLPELPKPDLRNSREQLAVSSDSVVERLEEPESRANNFEQNSSTDLPQNSTSSLV